MERRTPSSGNFRSDNNDGGSRRIRHSDNSYINSGSFSPTTAATARAKAKSREMRRKSVQEPGEKRSYYDFTLIFLVICACAFGLIMLYSVTAREDTLSKAANSFASVKKQAKYVALGIAIMIGASFVNYRLLMKRFALILAAILWAGAILMVLLAEYVPKFGKTVNGQSRWFRVGGVQFQPAEIVKLGMIVLLAALFARLYRQYVDTLWCRMVFIILIIASAGPVFMNNLSSSMIILMIGAFMMYQMDKNHSFYYILLVGGLAALVVAYKTGILASLLKDYQMLRIEAWLHPEDNPNAADQSIKGFQAIASGGFFGKGLGRGIQKLTLPEAQNDMIFSVICEELGLFGALMVTTIYGLMLWRMKFIAEHAPDILGMILTYGVMIHISLQAILHIAVNTGAMMNTGIGLPFISSGGSAIVFLMAEMALVLSVSKRIKE